MQINLRKRIPAVLLVFALVCSLAPSVFAAITLDTSVTVVEGETVQLACSDAAATFESTDTTVATVDATGLVTGVSAGTATVTATASDGSTETATCAVTVTAAQETTTTPSIALNASTLSLTVGSTSTLTATVVPSGQSVTWVSGDTSVATVASGKVTAIAEGTADITASITVNGTEYSAVCAVTVTASSSSTSTTLSTVTYTVDAGDYVTFDKSDFSSKISYLQISALPSSSRGVLYYEYSSDGDYDSKVDTSTKYYYSTSQTYNISEISFVASSSYSGSFTLSYTAADSSGTAYTGSIKITVEESDSFTYSTDQDEPLTFDSSDFNSYCKDQTGYNVNYITFTLPSSSYGVLYYDYDDGDYDSKVTSSTKYYRSDDPAIDDVTFVPKSSYTGTFTLSFSGKTTNSSSFSGTVKITVGDADEITYSIDEDEELDFVLSDFTSYSSSVVGGTLNYVQFTPPSSSKGVLYYKYDDGDYDSKVTASTKYYRSSSPKISDVTFVPASGYTGTVSISFSGENTSGDSFDGTIKISVDDDDSTSGDVTYTAKKDVVVTFSASDFNDYCQDETGSNVNYITFSSLPSSSYGKLYYEYDEDSGDYDSAVSTSKKYYRSSSPYIDDISFVPKSGYTGTVSINFSGKSTGSESFSGTIKITYSSSSSSSSSTGSSTTVTYYTSYAPVSFLQSDFQSICTAQNSSTLSSIQFNSLPSSAAGKLYVSYTSPSATGTAVATGTSYSASTISSIVFVPKAEYTGTITLPYTATDAKDKTYTAYVTINITAATSSKVFGDMGNYTWAAGSVDYIYAYNITTGTTSSTYNPAGNITRGDFILMLYRAFNLQGDSSENFPDVPADSYYATAIGVAKTLGIAQGSDGYFNPTEALTREDAMVLILRTMQQRGYSISTATSLSAYTDASAVSSYAIEACATLSQAGVIKGDSDGNLNPENSLTRAEMAVILHRALTL
ncbi:MAG: S-layer homology domain-containing protein [Oscillospiraceae bacterium]|nr:S-layer homology domain-containing protein [Oscillospiraceae bacterium]